MHTMRYLLLLLCAISSITTEFTPDITLLIRKNDGQYESKCVASGPQTLTYGMTWFFKNDTEYLHRHSVSAYSKEANYIYVIDDFSSNTQLNSHFQKGVTNAISAGNNFPPVTDYRWESFEMRRSGYNLNRHVSNINLSVLLGAKKSVSIYVNDKELIYTSELNEKAWHHLTIHKNGASFKIPPSHEYQNNAEQFYAGAIEIKSNNIWKLHDYSLLLIPETTEHRIIFAGSIRALSKRTLCISFFLFTETACNINLILHYESEKTDILKNYTTNGKWVEYRITDAVDKNAFFELSINKTPSCFAAMDEIRHCILNETRSLNLSYHQPVECVSLVKPQRRFGFNAQRNEPVNVRNVENVGRFNNVSCEGLRERKYCTDNVICGADGCYCPAGRMGTYCKRECNSNEWGINCRNKCQCESCDKHIGCDMCLNGVIDSSCKRIDINATIDRIHATAISFSLSGYERYKIDSIECEKGDFNMANNIGLLYNLMPNTLHNLTCQFCHSARCDPRNLTTFHTKTCTGLSENNILISVNNSSINLNVTRVNFAHCLAEMYEVYCSNNYSGIMGNFTEITGLSEDTVYDIEIKSRFHHESVRFQKKTDYSAPLTPVKLSRNENDCFTIIMPKKTTVKNYTLILRTENINCNTGYNMKENKTLDRPDFCLDLRKYNNIEILVSANNDKGNGQPFTVRINTQAEDALSEDEYFFDASVNAGKTNRKMADCEKTNGPLFYRVSGTCLEHLCAGQTAQDFDFEYAEPNIFENNIAKLYAPFTLYNITVFVSRSRNSPLGHFTRFIMRTPPARPNPVEDFSAYHYEDSKLFVRWKQSKIPTGEIENYAVKACRHDKCKSAAWASCGAWKEFFCSEIKGLTETLQYNITVTSKNKYVDEFNSFNATVYVTEIAPGKPEIIKATRTGNCYVDLAWKHPEFPGGRITTFDISTKNERSEFQGAKITININDTKTSYNYQLKSDWLEEFTVTIRANNRLTGQESLIKIDACQLEGNSTLLIILLSVFSVIIGCLIISALVFVYFKRRKPKQIEQLQEPTPESVELIPRSLPETGLKKSEFKRYLLNVCNEFGVNILEKQFANLSKFDSATSGPQLVGNRPENRTKNRFTNVIPYDNTRIVLNDSKGGDYINANYVHDTFGKNIFIAAQCPKRETAYDFWRMIWQEKVQLIVCLATVSEGAQKIFQYWPQDHIHVYFEEFMIVHKSNYVETDFVVKHFEIKMEDEKRDILHLNFISWPDHSIPLFPQSLYKFLLYIHDLRENFNTGPTLVHCSAGIGRTGTYIMCDSLMKVETDSLDVQLYLEEIRKCRPSLVSRESQYKLIYFILDEHFNGQIGRRMLTEDVFNKHEDEINAHLKTIFQYTLDRQYAYDILYSEISASEMPTSIWLEGYQGERKFITVSLQQKSYDHIWWTINQKDIKTVLVLQSKELNLFWPTDVQEKRVDSFAITLLSHRNVEDCSVYDLEYTQTNEVKTVRVYHYKNWNCSGNQPNNTTTFIKLYNMYKALAGDQNANVMLCCQDGSVACGVFITLDLVVRKWEMEKVFDISWAVLGIRQHNKSFMRHLEQFKLIYDLVKYYTQNKNNEQSHYENLQNEPIYENI